ncbi:TPA: DUF3908 family protein [Bacillus cereus]|nr:DUF3908 family protein [Bacillus cereus]HDR6272382.1 DUF3908 family protein [Bacillus cereus]
MYNNLIIKERIKIITISELRQEVQGKSHSSLYHNRVEALIKTLDENNIIENLGGEYLFYPKNLWIERKGIELFFFSKHAIKICDIDSFYNVNIHTLSTKSLRKLELLNINKKSGNVELLIHVLNEEPIKLSNKKDTNDAWGSNFYNLILEIHAQLNEQI